MRITMAVDFHKLMLIAGSGNRGSAQQQRARRTPCIRVGRVDAELSSRNFPAEVRPRQPLHPPPPWRDGSRALARRPAFGPRRNPCRWRQDPASSRRASGTRCGAPRPIRCCGNPPVLWPRAISAGSGKRPVFRAPRHKSTKGPMLTSKAPRESSEVQRDFASTSVEVAAHRERRCRALARRGASVRCRRDNRS